MTPSPRPQTRALLWIGFGGLLGLLAFAGFSALSIVRQIQIQNQSIRSDYVKRDQVLEQLRSDIYLSGTYVRDFLLEGDHSKAERYRDEFEHTRERIERALVGYRYMLRPEEIAPFQYLSEELSAYFDALKPALQWNAEERRVLGPPFMRDQVLRRRMTMISLANQVGQVNQHQMESGNKSVEQLFGQFRRRLLIDLGLTLSFGILLAAISMTRILNLERAMGERYHEIAQARGELQELSAKMVDAQERERRSIARELHDEVGQTLSVLLLGVANLSRTPAIEADPALRELIQSIRSISERSVAAVRNMSLLLRPSMLDDLGLVPALQWQAREVSRNAGLRVKVAAEGVSDNLPEDHKTCIYRIVQEALHNCSRHANAQTVRIQVQQTPDRLVLSIQDDGQGFNPVRDKGLGLLGMEERVKHLGGSFQATSEVGQGTLLSVELPLAATRPGA
ncbi:MAG: sensor histidine kinase [Acidobacteriota bacterium]|nr:sensor histidine kinase [Acidobacteriota bacterium]